MSILNLTHTQTEKAVLFYKLCANYIKLQELSDEDLLKVATFTKLCPNALRQRKHRWAADWKGMGLNLSSTENKKLWELIAEHVDKVPSRKLPLKTIAVDYSAFAQLDEDLVQYIQEDNTPAENVYNIYEASGKIVHRLQVEDYLKGNKIVLPEQEAIDTLKKLKLSLPQLATVQEYINRSVSAKTKHKISDLQLPEHLLELRGTLAEDKAKLLSPQDMPNLAQYIGRLGLQGYQLATVAPEFNQQGDIKYYKTIQLHSFEQAKTLPNKGDYGLAAKGKPRSNRPVLVPTDVYGHSKLTTELYLGAIVNSYKDNKELIKAFKPKIYHITRPALNQAYQWNYKAIALDFYYTHKIAIHPEVFENTTIFEGKTPLEVINEI